MFRVILFQQYAYGMENKERSYFGLKYHIQWPQTWLVMSQLPEKKSILCLNKYSWKLSWGLL